MSQIQKSVSDPLRPSVSSNGVPASYVGAHLIPRLDLGVEILNSIEKQLSLPTLIHLLGLISP